MEEPNVRNSVVDDDDAVVVVVVVVIRCGIRRRLEKEEEDVGCCNCSRTVINMVYNEPNIILVGIGRRRHDC